MEQETRRYEQGVGPFTELIDLFVEEGLRGSEEDYHDRPEKLQGCKDGLAKCRYLRGGDVIDFEFILVQMKDRDRQARQSQMNGEISIENYWQKRYATLQVEYCYDVLRVAHTAQYGDLPDDQRGELSARSIATHDALTMKLALRT